MQGTVLYEKGSLDSTFACIRMTQDDIRRAAGMDWNRLGRRVVIDPVRQFISWMSPSAPHAIMTGAIGDMLRSVSRITGLKISPNLLDSRWKKPGDPGRGAMEADVSFYIGSNAVAYRTAYRKGTAFDFMKSVPPDLVVEVEAFHADRDKPQRWSEFGVTEMWRLEKGIERLTFPKVEILGLQPECRSLRKSALLPGIGPNEISRAVDILCEGDYDEVERFIQRHVSVPPPENSDGPGI